MTEMKKYKWKRSVYFEAPHNPCLLLHSSNVLTRAYLQTIGFAFVQNNEPAVKIVSLSFVETSNPVKAFSKHFF